MACCVALVVVAGRASASGVNTVGEQLVWPGTIEALERQLSAEDIEVRRQAAVELRRLPSALQRRLLPTLFSDPDPEVRLAVADAALSIRLPDAGSRVAKWLSDPDARVRAAAAEVLAVLPHPSSVSGLGRVLEDPEPSVRAAAALALGNSRSPEASLFLLGHLDDGDPEVRHAVIAALEDLGDRRAVVPLIGRIQEQRAALRRQAAAALGTLRDPRATSALIVALGDGDAQVRAAAALSLGQLRAHDAVWSLGALLETETDSDVQGAALDALGSIATVSSVEAILRATTHARRFRDRIERALSHAGEIAIPSLERCVFQPTQAGGAESCLGALGSIGGERAKTLIELALRQGLGSPQVALTALGRAGASTALPTVLEYLTSAAPAERRAAIDAANRLLMPDRELGLAVEPIVLALNRAHGARLEQAALIGLLGRTGSPRAAASLIPLANANDEYLRAIALEALGQLGPAGADAVLLSALDSPHFPTRWTAAIALRRVGSRESLEVLLKRFETTPRSHHETLAVALAGPLAHAPSQAQLSRVVRLFHTSSGSVKDALIEALARVPAARGLMPFVELLPVLAKASRAKLAEALGGHSEAHDSLVVLARDEDGSVRANAVWSLGAVGLATDLEVVAALVDDRDIAVAANAVAALARLAKRVGRDVAVNMCRALTDARSYVRVNALTGLRMSAAQCTSSGAPAWLLEHHPSDEVRLAAARLIRDQPHWAQGTTGSLERCAAKDASGSVAAECARTVPSSSQPAPEELLEVGVLIVPTGSHAPAPRVPFALVRADGYIRSGTSDRRGSISEVSTPRGPLRLTVPAVFAD